MKKKLIQCAESGILPDFIVRYGIRQRHKATLTEMNRKNLELLMENNRVFFKKCSSMDIAIATDQANTQHYELPTAFFKLVLGEHLKYSGSYYSDSNIPLTQAESDTLKLYSHRAQLQDGQSVLDLGCGWGSLSLFLAKRYPNSNITAVSNSKSQKIYIDSQSQALGLTNLNVITCDINTLTLSDKFDRILSIEMLEHVSNHRSVFKRIAHWLKPDGLLFIHVFTHLLAGYAFAKRSDNDWIAKYFFTGGMMPASHQFLHFQDDLKIKDQWLMNGTHYQKTSNAWLINMDRNKKEITEIMKDVYGKDFLIWRARWRIFFMTCAELFGYNNGSEWLISHYLFQPR